ncbi:nuclear transport factor 2 family protein [Caenimonas soli]|uniref:nuclear transport factor 2 family protein n=1 Tax=Caenimonas soli TaxID=2735555 RepID=UPI00155796F5|nr:nuclear transport factor 2 family protein [Caenimonas soli]NPC58657.1 SnoaL-like domain-containing protein [Caenimonas soli]
MDSSDTKQIVKNAWKAFASHDAEQIAAVFTEDAQWLAPPGNATAKALGHTGHVLDRKTIVHFMAHEFPTLFVSNVELTFTGLVAEGSTAVLEHRLQATLANGRHYDNDYCFVIETRDGRIRRMREYMDTQRGFKCIFGDAELSRAA